MDAGRVGLTYAQGEELRHEVRERVALDWRTPGLRLEAIAYASVEVFSALVNIAGDVPVDGSTEESRQLRAA